MFFLIRTAFWLSVVIMLLPTPESMKTSDSGIGAAQAVTAASATVSDMGQFCSRQPEACQVGSQALTHLGHKAVAADPKGTRVQIPDLPDAEFPTHSEEHLVTSDKGIGLQRRMLRRALETVAAGGNPPGLVFDEDLAPVHVPSGNFFRD